jgi:hypothetical protein
MRVSYAKVTTIKKATTAEAASQPKAQTAQLPIDTVMVDKKDNLNPRYTFDSFIVGPFNQIPFIAAKAILENLCRMVDGLPIRRATARAYFGLYDGTKMTILHGEIHGKIAEHPLGTNGFSYGWDSIFCPDGYGGRTRAELNQDEYDEVYRAIRPIKELCEILS